MSFNGKKTTIWNKVNNVRFISIPEIPIMIEPNQIKEYKESKDIYGLFIVFGVVIFIIMAFKSKGSFDVIKDNYIQYLIMSLLAITLMFFGNKFANKKDKIILTISINGLEFHDKYIRWSSVQNMFLKEYYNDSWEYDLVIEQSFNSKHCFSLHLIKDSHEAIIHEIGMYYWNWKQMKLD